jgi:superfamily II DNA or RNA helicase
MKPRIYQLEAVWAAVNERQGVIKLPTGAGKTVVATLVIRTLNQKTLFLTHKKDILKQTYDRFCLEFGKDKVGLLGDGMNIPGELVTVAMVQTLVKQPPATRLPFLKEMKVFIGDEIHHAGAKTWSTTIKSCKAVYRIGLTATPFDGPKAMSLEASTGPVIYTAKIDDLADKGYLSRPEVVMVPINKPEVSDRFDYHQAVELGITENTFRNKRIVNFAGGLVKRGYGPVLVFSTTLKHLGKLMVLSTTKGLNFNVLSGSDSTDERKRTIERMKDGKLDVLFVSTIFDEGVDIPNVGAVIMAAVGKSKTKLIQRLGRGMRVAKGKNTFLVVDFYDDTCKYLLNHSKKRRTIYKKEGHPVFVGSLTDYMKGK